jgi:hypothetical protein
MTIRSTLVKLTIVAVTITATAALYSVNDTAEAGPSRDPRAQITVRDHRAQPIAYNYRPGARWLCQILRCR